jgi:plasmid maintenance system antidote protein VapI
MCFTLPRARVEVPYPYPTDPLRTLATVLWEDYMRPNRMNVQALALMTRLPEERIRAVLDGGPLDAKCTTSFAKVFGTTAMYWRTLKTDLDEAHARRERDRDLAGWDVL